MTRDSASTISRSCPTDELLVAAVTGASKEAEQRWLDEHLDSCDRCLDALATMLRRLRMADEIPATVPPAVHQRAAAAAALPDPLPAVLPGPRAATDRSATRRPATTELAAGWLSGVRDWLAACLRPPVMIPAAVGLVAVLAVATQLMTPAGPRPMTRSIALPQHVRVTAPEAPVRRQPNGHAEVVATVTRGMTLDINGEERDWLHITLPNGTEGWIDQGALR